MSLCSPVRLCGALLVFFVACAPAPKPEGPCAEGACVPDASVPDSGTGLSVCDRIRCLEPNRGVCTPEGENAVRCSCNRGYVEINGACLYDDPCEPNPCTETGRTTCVAQGDEAVCHCDPGFLEDGEGACLPEEVRCEDAHRTGDRFEPDECPAFATVIDSSLSEVEHTLAPEADQDWYVIQSQPGLVYRIRARAIDVQLSLRVFSAPVLTSEMASIVGKDVALEVRAPTTDPLFIRVRATTPTNVGTYWFSVEPLGFDDHGDTSNTSTALPVGSSLSGEFEREADVDWFSFTAPGQRIHRVECLPAGSCALRLHDEQNNLIQVGAPPDHLNVAELAEARYYLRVQPLSGSTGAYTVSHADVGTDDHGDAAPGASPLTVGSTANGELHFGDHDVFRLEVTERHAYEVSCTPVSGVSVCYVVVSRSDGALVASGEGLASFKAQASTSYFVTVRANTNELGSYSLEAMDHGEDLHGDTADDATKFAPISTTPLVVTGDIEIDTDVDFFEFTAEVGKQYALYVLQAPETRLLLSLYLHDGASMGPSDGDEHPGFIYSPGASTVPTVVRYASVRRSFAKGPYQLAIQEVTDDHANVATGGTWVTTDAAFTGVINYVFDRDRFFVHLNAGTTYTFSQSASDTVELDLEVKGPQDGAYKQLSSGAASYTATFSGVHELQVTASPAEATGTYELLIQ